MNRNNKKYSVVGFVLLILNSILITVFSFIGAGEVLHEYLHIPYWFGGCLYIALFIVATFLSMYFLATED